MVDAGTVGKRLLEREKPHTKFPMDYAGLHGPPYVKGNHVYCGYNGAGMVILDISDIRQPKLVGRLNTHAVFGGKGEEQEPIPYGLCRNVLMRYLQMRETVILPE